MDYNQNQHPTENGQAAPQQQPTYPQQSPYQQPYVQQPRNPYQQPYSPQGGRYQKPPKKKKWPIVLGVVVAVVVVLGIIGSLAAPETEDESGSSEAPSSTVSAAEDSSTSSADESTESSASTESVSSDEEYFADGVAQTEDFRIEITDYRVIMPGEEGNEYGDDPVIAFWYNTTNLSGEETSAMTAWIMTFTAVQDNDPNMVNELSVASLPDDRFLQSQMQTIKEGGTVENAMAYTLTDTTTPVVLTAKSNIFLDDELGSQTFNLE